MRIRPDPFLPTALLAAAAAPALTACGEPPGRPVMGAGGPPQVSVTTVTTQRLALTTEPARPRDGGAGRRGAAAGRRPGAGAPLQGRRRGQGRRACSTRSTRRPTAPASTTRRPRWPRRKPRSMSARLKAGRYRELSAIKAVSQQDADDAEASLLQAQADVGACAGGAADAAHQPGLHPHRPRRSAAASAAPR